jgi:hypothetical protein
LLKKTHKFEDQPQFLDYRLYKCDEFTKETGTFEERLCSPLAIAVNCGDLRMVSLVFKYMRQVEVDRGLTVMPRESLSK